MEIERWFPMFAAVKRARSVEVTDLLTLLEIPVFGRKNWLCSTAHWDKPRTSISAAHPCGDTETSVVLLLPLPGKSHGVTTGEKSDWGFSVEDHVAAQTLGMAHEGWGVEAVAGGQQVEVSWWEVTAVWGRSSGMQGWVARPCRKTAGGQGMGSRDFSRSGEGSSLPLEVGRQSSCTCYPFSVWPSSWVRRFSAPLPSPSLGMKR